MGLYQMAADFFNFMFLRRLCLIASCAITLLYAEKGDSDLFYLSPIGEKILDPTTYTREIRELLAEEERLLISLLPEYDALLEVGCGSAERAERVVYLGRQFYGIEINPHYVELGRALFREKQIDDRATIDLFSAHKLNRSTFPLDLSKRSLIFFPFNLMGNLDDFHLVLLNLFDLEQDFCFTTYKVTSQAEKTRAVYYTQCGCADLVQSATPLGTLFTAEGGFHSAAFRVGYLFDLLEFLLQTKQKKAKISVFDIHDIGYLVYVRNIGSNNNGL